MSDPKPKRNQSVADVAEELSVTQETVRRWLKDGCPGSKSKGIWKLDATECVAWLHSKGRDGSPGRPAGAGSEDLDGARLRKELAMAHNWELRNAQATGNLLDRAEVEAGRVERVAMVRNRLMACGASLAPQCEHRSASEIQGIIDHHMREVCEQFASE